MGAAWSIRRLVADLEARGDAPSVVAFAASGPETWTCAGLASVVRRLAAGLEARGIAPGGRVAIWGPNAPAWIAVALAAMAAGAVIVPIDDLATPEEAVRFLAPSHAKLLITTRAHAASLAGDARAALDGIFAFDGEGDDAAVAGWHTLMAREPAPLARLDPGTAAALIATSGTTGAPRLFVLSHANIAANVAALAGEDIATAADRALLPLPLHHVYPVVVGVLVPLTIGATVILPESVSGPHIVAALKEGRATVMFGVPRLYEALLGALRGRIAGYGSIAHSLFDGLLAMTDATRARFGIKPGRAVFAPVRRQFGPRLRLLVSGGAHLPEPMQSDLESLGWQVLPGYGLAETASVFTAMRPGERRPGSAGRALGQGGIRIDAPDAAGVGEILLKGASITAGYVSDAAANAASFTADGWFRTGDLGRLDRDGFLFVVGRAKEMIALGGGRKANPEDLEKTYGASPLVEEIAVLERDGRLVALALPDSAALRAMGVVEPSHAIKIDLAGIMHGLASHERLAGIAITRAPLPRTRLGKLRRFQLPQLYEQALSGARAEAGPEEASALAAFASDAPGRAVVAALKARDPGRALRLDASPTLDLGLDSLTFMGVGLELEERLGINLADAGLTEARTVAELIERVRAAGATTPPADGAAPARLPSDTPEGTAARATRHALHAVNRLAVRVFFRMSVTGANALPTGGPLIIAPNHLSDIDPMVVAASLPRRTAAGAWWAGDATRLFQGRASRFFCRIARIFPIDEITPRAAMAAAAGIVARRGILVWFPEGWRSPDGALQDFRPGIGAVILETGAPVVPVHIDGTFEAMPRGRRFPRPVRVSVTFGAAIAADQLVSGAFGEGSAAVAAALRARVAALAAPHGTDTISPPAP